MTRFETAATKRWPFAPDTVTVNASATRLYIILGEDFPIDNDMVRRSGTVRFCQAGVFLVGMPMPAAAWAVLESGNYLLYACTVERRPEYGRDAATVSPHSVGAESYISETNIRAGAQNNVGQ